MKALITGSSGLVGSALKKGLSLKGDEVICLLRGDTCNGSPVWNPKTGFIDLAESGNVDVAIHLAGDNIAEGRWNDEKKNRILNSRVNGTKLLAEYLAQAEYKPSVFVSASAIGIYGDRGDDLLDEDSAIGSGFLADVCKQWEEATSAAADAGIRVVNIRLGIVLSGERGALVKMLFPFRMGIGGVIGNGNQYMSWVSIDDVTRMIQYVINNESISGAVNLVSPHAVTNRMFTKILGEVLHRPTIFPMPALVTRLVFGEMADSLLLASTNVTPQKLLSSDYEFEYPDLKEALQSILSRG